MTSLISYNVYSQYANKWINPVRGRYVDFKFNSLQQISNGKTLGNGGFGYTEIEIYFDTVGSPAYTGWELVAYANTSTLEAQIGTNDMNLDEIELICTVTSGTATVTANSLLSENPDNVIVTGLIGEGNTSGAGRDVDPSPAVDMNYLEWTVSISYECGVASGLSGYDSDYYYTDLIFYIRAY